MLLFYMLELSIERAKQEKIESKRTWRKIDKKKLIDVKRNWKTKHSVCTTTRHGGIPKKVEIGGDGRSRDDIGDGGSKKKSLRGVKIEDDFDLFRIKAEICVQKKFQI